LAPAFFERLLGARYVAICQQAVLGPAGIGEVDVGPSDAIYYNLQALKDDPRKDSYGDQSRDEALRYVGMNGWKLGASHMAKLIFETVGGHPQIWTYMTNNKIGCRAVGSALNYQYFGHAGAQHEGSNVKSQSGQHSAWIWMQGIGSWPGTIAAININSN